MECWYETDNDDECDFSQFRTEYNNECMHCGGSILMVDDELICTSCNMISHCSVEDYIEHTNKITTIKTMSVDQCKQLVRDIELMNKDCHLVNVRPLPRLIINTAVNIFSDLKKCIDETRNKKRRQYIASCLYVSSRIHNLLRSRKEIQLFCGLSDRNITTTISEIYVAVNKGTIKIDGLKDIRISFAKSICTIFNINDKFIDNICSDVIYIMDIISNNMLISSNFDGKTLGSVYVSLKINGFDIDAKEIASISSINIDTIMNINKVVFNNNHLFTRFNDRCLKIAEELGGNVTNDDIRAYIKNKALE